MHVHVLLQLLSCPAVLPVCCYGLPMCIRAHWSVVAAAVHRSLSTCVCSRIVSWFAVVQLVFCCVGALSVLMADMSSQRHPGGDRPVTPATLIMIKNIVTCFEYDNSGSYGLAVGLLNYQLVSKARMPLRPLGAAVLPLGQHWCSTALTNPRGDPLRCTAGHVLLVNTGKAKLRLLNWHLGCSADRRQRHRCVCNQHKPAAVPLALQLHHTS
jgi:hypothetical protein